MKTSLLKSLLLISLIGGLPLICMTQNCFQCDGNTANEFKSAAFGIGSVANGVASFAAGCNSTANGPYSTTFGSYSYSEGQSIAMGFYAKSTSDQSFAIGRFLQSANTGSITIGSGINQNPGYTLVNTIANSLMIGFNSSHATLFVGATPTGQETGYVGIGTTIPTQPLHIKGNTLIDGHMYLIGDLSNIIFSDRGCTGTRGDFGIEYHDGGLNFWKPWKEGGTYSGNNYLFIKDNGNVGIGTGDPQSKLHVEGLAYVNGVLKVSSLASPTGTKMVVCGVDGTLSNAQISAGDNLGAHIATRNLQMAGYFITNDEISGNNDGVFIGPTGNVGIKTNQISDIDDLTVYAPNTKDAQLRIKAEGTRSSILWNTNGSKSFGMGVKSGECAFFEDNLNNKIIRIVSGKVGIGVPDEQPMLGNHSLFVVGGITAEEVVVKLKQNWSDYVFEEGYEPMNLIALEHFIKMNHHLPEIPSQREIEKSGINLGQTNALLLKKIEELTLYIM